MTPFFLLVFALSLPLWVLGGLYPRELLPGVPLSALMVLAPTVAALLLAGREDGRAGVVRLARRALDLGRIETPAWLVPVVLLMPLIAAAAYGVARVLGQTIPPPEIPWWALPGLTLVLLAAALAEELGWSGYATPRMLDRMGPLRTGLLVGAVTALWHVVPLLQAGRTPEWAAWQMANLVATRVLLVWLFINTGSVAATALAHATVNLSWQLFPVHGSHYDPRVVGVLTAAVAVVVMTRGPGAPREHRRRS